MKKPVKKYAVVYQKPWEDQTYRTRLLTLNTAKKRLELAKSRGWKAAIASKEDLDIKDPKRSKVQLRDKNKGRFWQFVPQFNKHDEFVKLICVRNGAVVPMEKCL